MVTKEGELDMGEATSTKPIRVGIYYCIPCHFLSTSLSFEILSIYPHSTKDFSQMWIVYRRSLGITERALDLEFSSAIHYLYDLGQVPISNI